MRLAHDIYAETNPAFCASVLVAFTTAYLSVASSRPDVPLVYIAIPVSISGDFENTFKGTNRNTGLREWLERNPKIQIGLSKRLNASMNVVSEAIRFGCFARVLAMDDDARLNLGDQKLKNSAFKGLSAEPAQVIKRAKRLGYWFATAGSARRVFDMMGLTV